MTKEYIQEFKTRLSQNCDLTQEELQAFFRRLEGDLKDKKYGLVWESQTEKVIEELKTHTVYLKEDQNLKIEQDPTNPKSNILIEGDNYEALTYLKQVNQKVDVIYIDPPYNTGNKDFKYDDARVDKEDGFRHSKWLSFMDARLRLARELLTDDGVIFISIDDNEQAQLKLLCDEVFGERNFVANMIWQKKYTVSNDKRDGVTGQTENILMYARKIDRIEITNRPLREEYVKKSYKNPDNDPRGAWRTVQMYKKKNPYSYEVTSPTGKKWYMPWNFTKESWDKLEKTGMIYWGKDGDNIPSKKVYLKDNKGRGHANLLLGVDYGYTSNGTEDLHNVFGKRVFDYPKPSSLIKYLISMLTNPNATVLDFFAGSGTTGHAVLELNQEDGGNRQFILVTNDENNIARDVTYERNKRVIEGYTTPKGKDVPGIPSNLAYYTTEKQINLPIGFDEVMLTNIIPTIQLIEGKFNRTQHSEHITQLGEDVFVFNAYMVEDDEINQLAGLVKSGDVLYIQEDQVDYIKAQLPEDVTYSYLDGILPTNY